jgi:hypothetical protein
VYFTAALAGSAQPPVGYRALCRLTDSAHQFVDIEDGMAGKHLGQSVGKVADQTMAGSLVQLQLKSELVLGTVSVAQDDVVRTLGGIAEQRFKKLVGTGAGQQLIAPFIGKKRLGVLLCHRRIGKKYQKM